MRKSILIISWLLLLPFEVLSQVDLYNGLVAYYTFNQTLNDSSGNNLYGLLRGPQGLYTSDRFLNTTGAYRMAGSSQITILGDTLFQFYKNDFSVSFWLRNTGSANSYNFPYLLFYEANPGYTFAMTHSTNPFTNTFTYMQTCLKDATGAIPIFCASPTSQDINTTSNPLVDGNWHLITFTKDSTELTLYIDYYLIYTNSTSAQPDLHTITVDSIVINTVNNTLADYLTFDDLMIYNRALTAAEVDSLYHLSASLPGIGGGNNTAIAQNSTSAVKVFVYPNPVHDNLIVQCAQTGEYIIQVFDLSGRMIWQDKQAGASYKIQCSTWEPGAYIIHVVDKTGNVFIQKFVKY